MSKARHLYFILNPVTGLVKIGIATDVAWRKRGLEHASGVSLEVLATVDHGEAWEYPLHMAFHEDRTIGEWFRPSDRLLALVDGPDTIAAFLDEVAPEIKRRQDVLDAERIKRQEAHTAELAVERAAIKAARKALEEKKRKAAQKREEARQRREAQEAEERDARLREFHERKALWLEAKGLRPKNAIDESAARLAKIAAQRKRNLGLVGISCKP